MDKDINKNTNATELMRAVKFLLISCSAGIVQVVSFTLLNEFVSFPDWIPTFGEDYGPAYIIALILSVLWNFTINRRYTFRSANNVSVAILKVFGYYCVFTPVSVVLGDYCVGRIGVNEYLVLAVTMVLNFITEYLFCTFCVYRKSMDTNAMGEKAKQKEERTDK